MQALAASGGLTLRGTQRGILVHRRGTDGTVQEMTLGMHETLQQDDVVFVGESLF
jgi:polysaccharide export outer membrane protein